MCKLAPFQKKRFGNAALQIGNNDVTFHAKSPLLYVESRLSLQDTDFIEDVEADIKDFIKNQSTKRVLIFPPFNSFRRCLVHQLVESSFDFLKTFSIGEGDERRTVVCFSKDLKSLPSSSSIAPFEKSEPIQAKVTNQFASDSEKTESRLLTRETKRPRERTQTMPAVSIYRPPAARKLEQNASASKIRAHDVIGGSSPEKSKIRCTEEVNSANKKGEATGTSVFRNAITSIRTQNKVQECKSVETTNKKNESFLTDPKPDEAGRSTQIQTKQRRPDIQVYVPKGRRAANTNSSNSGSFNGDNSGDSKSERQVHITQSKCKKMLLEGNSVESFPSDVIKNNSLSGDEISESERLSDGKVPKSGEDKKDDSISDSFSQSPAGTNEKEPNTKSVENISEKERTQCEEPESKVVSKPSGEVHLNPDECDWESMFDDTGECLDPTLLEQLTTAVGDVTIEKPKSSYNGFKTKSLDVLADEFPHVIEIYNFPPEFQLQDLMTVFSQFKNSGFEIKWVDETHALGIFSSSAVVSEVLSFYHPFVKTRSLKDGTSLSKLKARRSAEYLLPYKQRPDTCPALARRLVTGALGVRLPTSREEREAEKKLLTKAREKKRLEAKQKEDAWEGTFS